MNARLTVVLVIVGAAVATTAVATAGAPAPTVADANAAGFLRYSAWARENDVTAASCTGTGPARKIDFVTRHSTFRCRVEVDGLPGGSVTAKALGPEWLRITSVTGGKLTRDRGLGALPKGKPVVDSTQAMQALKRSQWAKRNQIEEVFCTGVGRWVQTPTQYRYFTFSCAPFDALMSRRPQVLVTAGKNWVRVVRTLTK